MNINKKMPFSKVDVWATRMANGVSKFCVKTIALLVFVTFTATPLAAQYIEAVSLAVEQIEASGYEVETVSKTFLGRVKVVSKNTNFERETVFHAVTLEVLSDRLIPISN